MQVFHKDLFWGHSSFWFCHPQSVNGINYLNPSEMPLLCHLFKARINKNGSKSSPLFNIGDRREQILHARLRLSCSSLNYDLYRKSIIDSPFCACGAKETAIHFLLQCPLYQHLRLDIWTNQDIAPFSEHVLNGNERLTFEHNKVVFQQVQTLIMATIRFNN